MPRKLPVMAIVLLAALAGGCAGRGKAAAITPQSWRDVATEADRGRVRNWRNAWTAALAKEQASGHAAGLAAAGALLQPDAALADARPPEGDYRCRAIKLGARTPSAGEMVRDPSFTCRIRLEGDILSFAKLDGPQRPVGLLFPGDAARMIFLGTMMLSDETMAMQYGRDPERDMAGAFERIGARRWRLVLPFPRWESTLDVIELVPLG